MVGPPLIPPSDPDSAYVPPAEVLLSLPDVRTHADPDSSADPSAQVQAQVDDLVPGPVMRAAAEPGDVRVLRGLLAHGFPATNYIVGPLNNPWQSALTNAVLASSSGGGRNFDEHVRLLVEAGADPNVFPAACYRVASTRFLRGRKAEDTWTAGCYLRDRDQALEDVAPSRFVSDPVAPLTEQDEEEEEVQGRRRARARFWAEHVFPRTDFPTNNPASSLSAAIEAGNLAIYAYLVAHGADETAWMDGDRYHVIAGDELPSYFVVESPLHVAVRTENREALQFLLDRGHKPDVFPMVLVTRCLNAVMATLAAKPWLEGFDLLAPHADLSLVTPIFRCHVLHFAVASLDLDAVKHVVNALGGPSHASSSVAPTALGHTLLHVASLPVDDSVATMHASAIYQSIHEFRTTDEGWEPIRLAGRAAPTRASMRGRGGRGGGHFSTRGGGGGHRWSWRFRPTIFRDLSDEERDAQAAVLLYLLDSGAVPAEQLLAQDVHGNTVLHYLASVRNPDDRVIQALRDRAVTNTEDGALPSSSSSDPSATTGAGERLWRGVKNLWGFSAEDLYLAGEAARAEFNERTVKAMPFWGDDE